MSMGLIPICTPAGGIVDVIQDGVNGFLTNKFDTDEFIAKVKEAVVKSHRISRNIIKDDYRKNYSMEVCANKYYSLYLNKYGKQA